MNPELSWLAGLFEGEGTITLEIIYEEKSKFGIRIRPIIELTISERDVSVVEEILRKYAPFNWQIRGNKLHRIKRFILKDRCEVKEFLLAMLPYFRLETTRRKAELLLKIIDILDFKGKHRSRFRDEDMEELLRLTIELKSLQKRQKLKNKSITRLIEHVKKTFNKQNFPQLVARLPRR